MIYAIQRELYCLRHWSVIHELIDFHYCEQFNREWGK